MSAGQKEYSGKKVGSKSEFLEPNCMRNEKLVLPYAIRLAVLAPVSSVVRREKRHAPERPLGGGTIDLESGQ